MVVVFHAGVESVGSVVIAIRPYWSTAAHRDVPKQEIALTRPVASTLVRFQTGDAVLALSVAMALPSLSTATHIDGPAHETAYNMYQPLGLGSILTGALQAGDAAPGSVEIITLPL
jgi:hypothetical protein